MDQLRVPLATAAAAGAGAGAGLGGGSLSPSLSRASSFTHVQHAESNDISTVMDQHKVELEHNDDESPAPVQPQQRARPPSVRSLNTSIPHAEPAKTRLCGEERRLALMYRKCGSRRSVAPLLFFLAASLGKLILGFGVALAIRGHYASIKSSLIVGIVLAVLGFSAVVAAALGFGAAASRVSRKWGLIFKAFSITGGVLIAIGYALNQYFVSDERPLFTIRLSFIPLAMGTACMGISLPNFTAFYELYAGRVVGLPLKYRPIAALLMLSPSMGALFGGWVSSEHGEWPVAFNAVVLTFVVALGYGGVALFWSEQLRLRASVLEMQLCKEEEQEDHMTNEKSRRQHIPRSPTEDSDLSSPTLAGSSTNTNKLPSVANV